MGTYHIFNTGHLTAIEFLKQEMDTEKHKIIDHSIKGSVAYLACQTVDKDGKPIVYGLVCELHRFDGDWAYKPIDESMGPYQQDCPLRILDRLTPTDDEYANNWRKACREKHTALRTKPKIAAGMTIELSASVRFSDGYEGRRFTVEKYSRRGRNMTVFRGDNGQLYRISRIQQRDYQVLEAPAARQTA